MAAAYTTTTLVEALLPDSLPASITAGDKARWISDASAMVDSLVGPRFPMLSTNQKFADTPSAPALIELCARWLAGYFGYAQLREINRTMAPSMGQAFRDLAEDYLKQIREGTANVYSAAGADMGSTEQIYSTTETRDPVFTRGEYVDGTLVSDDEGTLDDFELDP